MDTLAFIKENCDGGTTTQTDSVFVRRFNKACDRLSLDKTNPRLISLAYTLYLDGIIHIGEVAVGAQATKDLLASLPVANLPKA